MWLKRIAGTARILARGGAIAVCAQAISIFAAALDRPGIAAFVFLIGVLGIFCGVLVAALSIPAAFLPNRWFIRSPDAPKNALGEWLIAGLVSAIAYWPALKIAERFVPHTLNMRGSFVDGTALAFALFCGFVATSIWKSAREKSFRIAIFVAGTQLFVLRVLGSRPLSAIFLQREFFLELFTLAAFFIWGIGLAIRLQNAKRWLFANSFSQVLAFGAIVFLFSAVGSMGVQRAAFCSSFQGACHMLMFTQSYFDLDGDGYSAILGGRDCDDMDKDVNPGTIEMVGNGKDDNCRGGDLTERPPYFENVNLQPTKALRNLVLVTVDSLRTDVVAPHWPSEPFPTPNLNELAKTSANFTRAYVNAPYTEESIISLMTGRYPVDFRNQFGSFGQERTLAELLGELGYRTVALHQIYIMNPYMTYGFGEIDEELSIHNQFFQGRTSMMMSEKAIARFDELSAQNAPFFLWVHYFDPHGDYMKRENTPFSGNTDRERYLQEVWATDHAIAKLLARLEEKNFFESGLLVVHGDHGEHLGEGGRIGHGIWMSEIVLRTPLMLKGADVRAGSFDTRVELVDVFPTIFELCAGVHVDGDGRTLARVWNGEETADRDVFAQNYFTDSPGYFKWAAYNGPYKLIEDVYAGTEQLYDLGRDPNETENLIEAEPEIAEKMRALLGERWDRSVNDLHHRYKRNNVAKRTLPFEVVRSMEIRRDEWRRKALERAGCDPKYPAKCEALLGKEVRN